MGILRFKKKVHQLHTAIQTDNLILHLMMYMR